MPLLLAACHGASAVDAGAIDAAPDAPIALDVDAAVADAAMDAAADADVCDFGCHWDCGGGSECLDGVAWLNGYGRVDYCTGTDPWPFPGPVCANFGHPCQGGTCIAPDPRYASCLDEDNEANRERLVLYCPEGAPKVAGAPCTGDPDCRPAAGLLPMRCDTTETHTCVREFRAPPPDDYGASCGLEVADVSWLDGETAVSFAPSCSLCQVLRAGDGCLRQGCTFTCLYDEDCPAGSICLCGGVPGYCAAATDRETPEGRAAGLALCP